MQDNIPSDIVELIIAVDLNPSDPEEPINVNDVKVNPKDGEGGGGEPGEDWKKLTMQLLEAADIRVSSYDEAAEAVAEILQDDVEDESPFDKANKRPAPDKAPALPHLMGNDEPDMDEDEEEKES